jgi:hypothetical protein
MFGMIGMARVGARMSPCHCVQRHLAGFRRRFFGVALGEIIDPERATACHCPIAAKHVARLGAITGSALHGHTREAVIPLSAIARHESAHSGHTDGLAFSGDANIHLGAYRAGLGGSLEGHSSIKIFASNSGH